MVIVGLDWARDKHDVCILDNDGNTVFAGVVRHDRTVLEQLGQRIAELEPIPSAVHVAVEQHDGALLAWLLHSRYTVYGINPKSADRARDIYRPAGGKDDRTDARVLADLLRSNLQRFKPMHAQSANTLHLRSLARLRTRLTAQKTALMQRLRTILAEWCPGVSRVCNDFNRKWQRQLIARWPLHEDLVNAHGNALAAFLHKSRLPRATREKIRAAKREEPMFIPEGRRDALRFEITLTLEQIGTLIEQLDTLDRDLTESFVSHPNFNVFNSLPVKGVPTVAMIASAFGDRRTDAPGWRTLAARWGVAPVTVMSGKSRAVHRRKACDQHVLQALSDFAFTTAFSVTGCWARTFYDRKRSKGHDHHESLRAVALRWVKIMWAMWSRSTVYDEDYHTRRAHANTANMVKAG